MTPLYRYHTNILSVVHEWLVYYHASRPLRLPRVMARLVRLIGILARAPPSHARCDC